MKKDREDRDSLGVCDNSNFEVDEDRGGAPGGIYDQFSRDGGSGID